jgi:hypothetical protein
LISSSEERFSHILKIFGISLRFSEFFSEQLSKNQGCAFFIFYYYYFFTIEGSVWFYLESPTDAPLTQISAGSCEVWVIDQQHRVYRRKEVMPMFPEGVAWEYVCDDVRHVSVNINDEVSIF